MASHPSILSPQASLSQHARLCLGAHSHAAPAASLAQALPRLSAALAQFSVADARVQPDCGATRGVHVYAACVSPARSHLNLVGVPALDAAQRAALQAMLAEILALKHATQADDKSNREPEWRVENVSENALAIASLNTARVDELALSPLAPHIGRNLALALPQSDAQPALAQMLRGWVNESQMYLHHTPLPANSDGAVCAVNSLWFAPPLPVWVGPLLNAWLQGGVSQWWEKLPSVDMRMAETLRAPSPMYLELAFAELSIHAQLVPFVQRPGWKFWQSHTAPCSLAGLLGMAQSTRV